MVQVLIVVLLIVCVYTIERGDNLNISPLEELLGYQLTLNVLIIILIIFMLYILFNRYILKYNVKFIIYLVQKFDYFMFANKSTRATDWIKHKLNKGIDYNNSFMFILFIINSILLVINLLLNFYVSAELYGNIDYYVKVYNEIQGNKSIFFFSTACSLRSIPYARLPYGIRHTAGVQLTHRSRLRHF